MKQIVSLSGGKDSTAMLFKLLENNEPIEEIIFCDTTVEFPQMYEHLAEVERKSGIKITRLKAEHDFEYMLCKYHRTRGSRKNVAGYGFCTSRARWCTAYFKRDLAKRYLSSKYQNEQVITCIGIAADEQQRAKSTPLERYPLIEYGMTEQDALHYCYDLGFSWGGFMKSLSESLAGVVHCSRLLLWKSSIQSTLICGTVSKYCKQTVLDLFAKTGHLKGLKEYLNSAKRQLNEI